jgi:hypothetical protein
MKIPALTAALASLICSPPLRAQSYGASAEVASVSVRVYNYVQVPPGTLRLAEREANKILAIAGARVEWLHCLDARSISSDEKVLCDNDWTPQTPALRLISGINRLQPREYGYTDIPVLITVYYDKIAHRAHRDYGDAEIHVVLGCVMAHELGHLFLRTPLHSANGIMQPEWGKNQIRDALTGHALFTKDQAIRIQSQTRILASLPRNPAQQAVTP